VAAHRNPGRQLQEDLRRLVRLIRRQNARDFAAN